MGPGGNPGTGGAPVEVSKGGVALRLLTQSEYLASLQSLLGTVAAPLTLPPDNSVAGFVSVGATQLTVTDAAVTAYETASLTATSEVFGDAARWPKLVGCQPKADLGDDCVATYVRTFGRSAFRRELTAEEVTRWLTVARSTAATAGTAAQGLAMATAGILQSPKFLYRYEKNAVDGSSGRLKYDGSSMATRLAYLLTGAPPSAALLAAAASGQLDTAEGIHTATAPLLSGTALTDRMTAFFSETVAAQQILLADKSASQFPGFDTRLKNSMLQGFRLWIRNVVLGQNADVRTLFDSPLTYADASLASIYGVAAPVSGFAQVQLPASSGRAGVMGQAAIAAAQSQTDRTSPTRRGVFILENLLCTNAPLVPMDVNTNLKIDPTLTTREQLELHRADPNCANCHQLFDPMGMALEHLDPIGSYRETENGKAIDATGTLNGVAFDGAAQLGAALRNDRRALSCLMRHFYRDANGRADDDQDPQQIQAMVQALAAHDYVWSGLVSDFVASDAFRSAPALPIKPGS